MSKKPVRKQTGREPIQVYLEARDRSLLDALAERASVSRAEIVRLGLRRLAADMLGEDRAGGSMQALIGVLDDARDVPTDLAARHDEYLYAPKARRKPRGSR
jgi:hypothetical protein